MTITINGANGKPITKTITSGSDGHYQITVPGQNIPSGPVIAHETTNPIPAHNKYTENAPVVTITKVSMNPDGSVTVIGTATPDSHVVIKLPNGTPVTATATSSGTYSVPSKAGVPMIGGKATATSSVNGLNSQPATAPYTPAQVT
ncbi:MAG: hypothetical protein GY914_09110, partial [Prochlorococcus sp.]|nr:hypothetical protein [Prochlorococcus sp.]